MICFNIPCYLGNEHEYILQAIKNNKLSGDGYFTNKCCTWLMRNFNTPKALINNILYTCVRNGGNFDRY